MCEFVEPNYFVNLGGAIIERSSESKNYQETLLDACFKVANQCENFIRTCFRTKKMWDVKSLKTFFQISALDTSTPICDRLSQVFNLSLLATCKALQSQYDENEDENLVSLIKVVKTHLYI